MIQMFIIYLTLRAGEMNQIEGGYSNSLKGLGHAILGNFVYFGQYEL